MLCKVNKPDVIERVLSNKSGSAWSSTEVSLGSFIMPSTSEVVVTFNTSYSNNGVIYPYVNWTKKTGYSYYWNTNNQTRTLWPYNKGDSIEIKMIWDGTTAINGFNADVYIYKMRIPVLKITPYDIKALWAVAICFLYWIDSDGVYKGGLMVEKSTTHTTGSISLWNAVGFISINFNWEILKIPYYL